VKNDLRSARQKTYLIIASLEAEKKKRGVEGTDGSAVEAIEPRLLKIGPVSLAQSTEQARAPA
jgi:hypothetical protein